MNTNQQTHTLGMSVTTSPYQHLFSYGHLIWWTVHQGIRDPQTIQQTAKQLHLPQVILDFLTGVKEKGAWEKATNLKTYTLPSIDDPATRTKITYTTRDVDSSTRILVREIVNAAQVTLEAKQYGVFSFDAGFNWIADPAYYAATPELANEIDEAVHQVANRYYERVDKLDDAKLRNALLRWLESRHRVSVRGNGGIYYLPNSANSEYRDQLVSEILAIRDWLNQCGIGVLTAIEIKESETTTLVDITQSALDEITTDLDTVEAALSKYTDNENMNAGSRMEASKAQVKKMENLLQKVEALEGSLGEKIGILKIRSEIVLRKSSSMHQNATATVYAERKAKGK